MYIVRKAVEGPRSERALGARLAHHGLTCGKTSTITFTKSSSRVFATRMLESHMSSCGLREQKLESCDGGEWGEPFLDVRRDIAGCRLTYVHFQTTGKGGPAEDGAPRWHLNGCTSHTLPHHHRVRRGGSCGRLRRNIWHVPSIWPILFVHQLGSGGSRGSGRYSPQDVLSHHTGLLLRIDGPDGLCFDRWGCAGACHGAAGEGCLDVFVGSLLALCAACCDFLGEQLAHRLHAPPPCCLLHIELVLDGLYPAHLTDGREALFWWYNVDPALIARPREALQVVCLD
mmetsp:Transcript_23180/g.70994  ORF Transcript_23180/g.70994 Transcript_23180/m.70994 type:complete len:286 (+) Transcript_23180:172-1029(+)